MQASLKHLLKSNQPDAVGYNGGGISPNPARWSKTEGDVPPGGPDVWSTACNDTDWGAGSPPEECPNPSGALFYPSGTDYTLQSGDVWFWEPSRSQGGTQQLRTLDELIYTYHQTVGHNTVLELDFAIDRNGQLEASHVALYKRFGDWIRACYGSALGKAKTEIATEGSIASATVDLGEGGVFDRVVLQEDQKQGQIIRGWLVEWSPDGHTWIKFAQGRSIGNKRIEIAPGAMSHRAMHVRLNITASYPGSTPTALLSVHAPCLTGTLESITKIGTEDIGMTETTPVVWNGSLYRFESVRSG